MDEITQMKLALYDEMMERMLEINEKEAEMIENKRIYNYHLTKDDSFVYLDEQKDLKELNIKDQQIINEQNNLYNFNKVSTQLNKYKKTYNTLKYFAYPLKWLPFV